jgi:hypothetical protein
LKKTRAPQLLLAARMRRLYRPGLLLRRAHARRGVEVPRGHLGCAQLVADEPAGKRILAHSLHLIASHFVVEHADGQRRARAFAARARWPCRCSRGGELDRPAAPRALDADCGLRCLR